MPEPYKPKRNSSYTLADAEKNSRYMRIWCSYCKLERYFLLSELRTAFGNIECDDILYQSQWKCTGCGGRINDSKVEDPPASQDIIVRRLQRVDYIRRPVWRDERR